ncbi:hypothetical protein [Sulfurimonas sp.]
MKRILLIATLMGIFSCNLSAEVSRLQKQEFPQEELKKQKIEVAAMVAEEISKTLPQTVDAYTVLTKVVNDGATIVYTFEINTGAKSDATVIKEDHSRMKRAVTKGICQSSRKFLAAGINTRYIYKSSQSKKILFTFNITQEKCEKPLQ